MQAFAKVCVAITTVVLIVLQQCEEGLCLLECNSGWKKWSWAPATRKTQHQPAPHHRYYIKDSKITSKVSQVECAKEVTCCKATLAHIGSDRKDQHGRGRVWYDCCKANALESELGVLAGPGRPNCIRENENSKTCYCQDMTQECSSSRDWLWLDKGLPVV